MSGVLNCDAAGCGHVEPVGEIIEAHIGMPCPKCGADLLTRSDYDHWIANIAPMVRLLEDAGLLRFGDTPGEGEARLSVAYHDGKTTIIRDGAA